MMDSVTVLFQDIVRRYPDNPAVVTDGTTVMTYAALDEKAFKIAAFLKQQPQGYVGLSLDKSPDYIAALLGCWYAGRAFIPLDPALPQERRAFMIDDASPAIILTAENLQDLADGNNETPFILQEDTLAYIIYTSGSTGEPKGVAVTHCGLASMLQAQINAFGLHAGSRSLFYLSTSFDASVSDIGTALLSGAALCIETGERMETAAQLSNIIKARGITYVDIPPSLLRLMNPDEMPDTLDTIVIGGEACPPQTVRLWAQKFKVINVYGPTEATVCTSLCRCDPTTWTIPLIGNPLPNVDYHIFDDEMSSGDEGELYIGGKQLASGYINRPALNVQKFITHNGQRLYRTGDLVKRHTNGDIEFLGRLDRQIKLNGQLIELEEIEKKLLLQKGIERAAVVRKSINGRDTLAAYVTVQDKNNFFPASIKSHLQRFLPGWMIPPHIIILDTMPLTASGKIDFRYLKSFTDSTVTKPIEKAFSPVTPIDVALLQAWKRILKKDAFDAHDSFFHAGGDSIAVLDLCLTMEKQGFPLSPLTVVEFPTLDLLSNFFKSPDNQPAAMTADALKKDVAFDDKWQDLIRKACNRTERTGKTRDIFLTGATGFLGGRLLRDLLTTTDYSFHVLVRAATEEEAWKRLNLSENLRSRIIIVTGDAAEYHFGLPQDAYNDLTEKIDTVIHCAAVVNMAKSYAELRLPNVVGTQNTLELCLHGKRKALHYASTLSVFVSTDRNTGIALETDRLDDTKEVYGGYAQSKWAAEYLLQSVPPDACDISIYRFGLVTGDTQEGSASTHDFLRMFVQGIVDANAVPNGPHKDIYADITPIDYACDAMSKLLRSEKPGTYHIANTKGFSLSDILRGLQRAGKTIPVIPIEKWRQQCAKNPAAYMALCRLMPQESFNRHRAMDFFQGTDIIFDMRRMREVTGLTPPPADDRLMDIYIKNILQD